MTQSKESSQPKRIHCSIKSATAFMYGLGKTTRLAEVSLLIISPNKL
eukprot:gene10801-12005_t